MLIGTELELHNAVVAAGAAIPQIARDYIDERDRDGAQSLRWAENAWINCGPVDGGDWTAEMSAYRDALYALREHQNNARMPLDPTAAPGRKLPLFEFIEKRGD